MARSTRPARTSRANRTSRATRTAAPVLDLHQVARDREVGVVVCCGSGGVGKTTMAAAVAVEAAEAGRRVVVLTIDPARRLAQSLGLVELDNDPRRVVGIDESAGGSLDALMLDMKRTFDEVVHAHATPDKAEQILENPFYQALSSSFAGTQEYMAMERLGQLRTQAERDGTWDLIVVDTPPSRSALDFLDAPARLGSFLDGRFVRLLMTPAKVGGRASLRVFSVGVDLAQRTISRVLGGDLLRDVQTFVAALDTMFGGFRERAEVTYALLSEPSTAFVVVASAERDALREAAFFVDRLREERMPLAGVVVNRLQPVGAKALSAGRALDAAEQLAQEGDEESLTAGLLRLHAEVAGVAARQRGLVEGFVRSHPDVPVVQVEAAATDVHDLDGLRAVARSMG